jgi:hypothetical protein
MRVQDERIVRTNLLGGLLRQQPLGPLLLLSHPLFNLCWTRSLLLAGVIGGRGGEKSDLEGRLEEEQTLAAVRVDVECGCGETKEWVRSAAERDECAGDAPIESTTVLTSTSSPSSPERRRSMASSSAATISSLRGRKTFSLHWT